MTNRVPLLAITRTSRSHERLKSWQLITSIQRPCGSPLSTAKWNCNWITLSDMIKAKFRALISLPRVSQDHRWQVELQSWWQKHYIYLVTDGEHMIYFCGSRNHYIIGANWWHCIAFIELSMANINNITGGWWYKWSVLMKVCWGKGRLFTRVKKKSLQGIKESGRKKDWITNSS